MLGQLGPPSLLVALSVLEALFFVQHGLRSVSLSYAQQTHAGQDAEAVAALRRLARELLPAIDWHVVVYTYMGVYPRTPAGALALLEESARLAVRSGAARLIVKTVAEAHRIPTVAENVRSLELASAAARGIARDAADGDNQVYAEAWALVNAVLDLDNEPGRALRKAFARGYLDVPFCLHPDNAGRSRSYLADDGRLCWADVGAMPLPRVPGRTGRDAMSAAGLLTSLSYVERRFDGALTR